MHAVTSSIFFSAFNSVSFLSRAQKARLLEWHGRYNLILYASRRSPQLLLEEITEYVPKRLGSDDSKWEGIFQRLFDLDAREDGHAVKFGRALAHAEQVCKEYEGEDWAKIKGSMWLKIGNMVIDSVEDTGEYVSLYTYFSNYSSLLTFSIVGKECWI